MSLKLRARVGVLLDRLEQLERQSPTPETESIRAIARDAIEDEIARLTRATWLQNAQRVEWRDERRDELSRSG